METNAASEMLAGSPGVSMATSEAGVMAAMARERYEVEGQIVMAQKMPRDEERSMAAIIRRCEVPSFADKGLYRFPRGDTEVVGCTVKLAREIGRLWRNLRTGFRVLAAGNGQVHLQGFAWDCETNVQRVEEAKVSACVYRKQYGRVDLTSEYGQKVMGQDLDRQFRELCGRHGAVLERNCILRVVGSEVEDLAQRECEQTMTRVVKGELSVSRDTMIRAVATKLAGLGVTREMIEARYGCRLHVLTPEQIVELRQIGATLRDGVAEIAEFFKVEAPPPKDPNGGGEKPAAPASASDELADELSRPTVTPEGGIVRDGKTLAERAAELPAEPDLEAPLAAAGETLKAEDAKGGEIVDEDPFGVEEPQEATGEVLDGPGSEPRESRAGIELAIENALERYVGGPGENLCPWAAKVEDLDQARRFLARELVWAFPSTPPTELTTGTLGDVLDCLQSGGRVANLGLHNKQDVVSEIQRLAQVGKLKMVEIQELASLNHIPLRGTDLGALKRELLDKLLDGIRLRVERRSQP